MLKRSFATTPYSDGSEADHLDALQKDSAFIPELSFVAQHESGDIIGYIAFSQIEIALDNQPGASMVALLLWPLCVHPDFFRRGIARALIKKSFKHAKALGYIAVFLCGEPAIFRKLGFKPSYKFGIVHKAEPKADWCMAKELSSHSLNNLQGTVDII